MQLAESIFDGAIYDLRAKHFALDNQKGISSLGDANSPSLSSY